eukprot:359188-Chlamydomonas_euryale.AAC.7
MDGQSAARYGTQPVRSRSRASQQATIVARKELCSPSKPFFVVCMPHVPCAWEYSLNFYILVRSAVYDVTRPETLKQIVDFWLPEFEKHNTHQSQAVKMIVGNKIDLEGGRCVSPDEGALVARDHSCLYYETSAKLDLHVQDAVVWGLLAQVMDTPSLLRPPPSPLDVEHPHEGRPQNGAQCIC